MDILDYLENNQKLKNTSIGIYTETLESFLTGDHFDILDKPILVLELIHCYDQIINFDKVIDLVEKFTIEIKSGTQPFQSSIEKNRYLLTCLLYAENIYKINGFLDMAESKLLEKELFYVEYPDVFNKEDILAYNFSSGYIFYNKLLKNGKQDTNRDLLEKAKKHFQNAINIDSNYSPAYKFLGDIYLWDNNDEDAEMCYEKSIINQMKNEIHNSDFQITVYKYMPINKLVISNIFNKNLYLNSPLNFNDPFDCPIFRSYEFKKNGIISEIVKKFKVTCFSEDCNSILLWSHYADSHKGVCVGYEINRNYLIKNNLHSGFVKYVENNEGKSLRDYLGYINEFFYKKNKIWKYEKEFRLVSYDSDKIIKAPKITEIIFGYKTTESDQELVKKIVEKNEIKIGNIINKKGDDINIEVNFVT